MNSAAVRGLEVRDKIRYRNILDLQCLLVILSVCLYDEKQTSFHEE